MKKVRKFFSGVAMLCLVGPLLFATGSQEKAPVVAAPASEDAEALVKLTVGVKDDIAVADWNENEMTKYIEDKLHVDLEFVTFSSKEMGTKLNLMAMDGAKGMPDILFYNAKDSESEQLGEMGSSFL